MSSHGTRARYTAGCRCQPCTTAQTAYSNLRNRRLAYGWETSSLVDAEPARAHVKRLNEKGMGRQQVCAVSGVTKSVVDALLGQHGGRPSRRIHRDNAAKLLSTRLVTADVDGAGTARRLQALCAVGWTTAELARRLQCLATGRFHAWLWNRGRVSRGTAARVAALYDELWNVHPTGGWADRSRTVAAERGWVTPGAWDDDEIDDPAAAPDMGERVSFPNRRIDPDEVEWLRSFGESDELIARRLGVRTHAIGSAMRRHEEAA